MVGDHPVFSLFVSGSSSGSATSVHSMICRRDVSMQSRVAREFIRHFSSDRHWLRDVTYRVQHDLPVYNQLLDPLKLTAEEKVGNLDRATVEKSEGFIFPEDWLPPCTLADSTVPLMTMVNCITKFCRCCWSYTLLKKLWGSFRATLASGDP